MDCSIPVHTRVDPVCLNIEHMKLERFNGGGI